MKPCSSRGRKKKTQVKETKSSIVKSPPRKWKLLMEGTNYNVRKVEIYSGSQVIDNINKKLTNRQKELFAKTCFGQFLQLQKIKFSTLLLHNLLLRQLDCPEGESSLWFRIGGKECEFGLKEFALITGLDCSERRFVESESGNNQIRDKYFNGHDRLNVSFLAHCFNDYKGNNDEDAVKLAQLYLLEGFLLSKDPRRPLDGFAIGLVNDPTEFNKYPWGRVVYDRTITSIKRAFERRGVKYCEKSKRDSNFKSYSLNGFPCALQCWAYECIPRLSDKLVSRVNRTLPRMLNWEACHAPTYKMFQKEIFSDDKLQVNNGLQPTEAEMNQKYMSYFSGKKNMKKIKNAVIEEDKPILEQVEEEIVTMEYDQKSVDYEDCRIIKDVPLWGTKRKRKQELMPDHLTLLMEKVRKEIEQIRDTISAEGSNFIPHIKAELRETMTETSKQRTKSLCLILSEEKDYDNSKAKNVVQRKRKRNENDIPCFTVDPFQHPLRDEKEEFDQWIKVGLRRNSKKNKYSEANNKIEPGFDFTVHTCHRKDWFFSLNETGQWLNGSHIDVALHFLRIKKKYHPNLFKTRCTTTQSWFYQMLNSRYPNFKDDPENFEWSEEGAIQNTLKGIVPDYSLPWIDAEAIYIPVNFSDHWSVAALDMESHMINIYDSYRTAKHNKEVVAACAPIAEMVPWLLKSAGFFRAGEELKNVTAPWKVKLVHGIPEQENGGDCGIFMLKFIEFLMQDVPLCECTQKKMPFFRNKMAVELFAYGKKRLAES